MTPPPLESDSHPDPPLRGYAVLAGAFGLASASFAGWLHRSDRGISDAVSLGDLALVSVATHKASRLLTQDRVSSPVRAPFTERQGAGGDETPARGSLRRAIGELVTCPHCISMWIGAGLIAGLLVAPRLTRWTCTVLTAVFASDLLQIAYQKVHETD